MEKPDVGKPRGILRPEAGKRHFQLSRHVPALDVAPFVEHYWIVEWDLRGQEPYVTETLPHPSIHVVFEQDRSEVVGVMRGKFSRRLEGAGRVFGIKFRPGGFYPFVKRPVSELTDHTFPIGAFFGAEGEQLEREILSLPDRTEMVACAEHFLRERLPEQDDAATVVGEIVYSIMADRAIGKVDDLAARLGVGKRWLQRTFSRYVGVSPKWVIQRYRLHEATEQLNARGPNVDWPKLALELGYFDQAHFIKDFKALVGVSPSEYVRGAGS